MEVEKENQQAEFEALLSEKEQQLEDNEQALKSEIEQVTLLSQDEKNHYEKLIRHKDGEIQSLQ